MRVAVLFFGGGKREATADIARGLVDGFEKAGHQVDLVDGDRDVNTKLTAYGYIAVGTASMSLFGGKIDARITEYLSNAGMIGGKKSFAFVTNGPFGAQKALSRLMATLEHEGLFIRFSETLRSREEAAMIAGRLKL